MKRSSRTLTATFLIRLRRARRASVAVWMGVGIIATFSLAAGCSFSSSPIDGSGTVQAKSYSTGDFGAIRVSDDLAVGLTIDPSGPPLVELSVDDNLHEHLIVGTEGDQLRIATSSNIAPTSDIQILISGYTVAGLEATSDATVKATLPTVPELTLRLDDDATMILEVDIDRLIVFGRSDAIATLTGRADEVDIDVADDAKAVLVDTSVISANIYASSDAIVELTASDAVRGRAENDAVVRVGGTATVTIETSSDAVVTGPE